MDTLLIIGVIAIVVIILINATTGNKKNGLITNKGAEFDQILNKLKDFNPKKNPKLKFGYTEKHVENQLLEYLRDIYETVTPQHGIAGRNAKSIDMDVADGKAGIEIKLANKVMKSSEYDRLQGQLMQYKKLRYSKGNLILLVCGEEKDFREPVFIDIIELCKEMKVSYVPIIIE